MEGLYVMLRIQRGGQNGPLSLSIRLVGDRRRLIRSVHLHMTGDVKGESIGKTPLDLYTANIQSQVFQRQSYIFRSYFQIQSTAI